MVTGHGSQARASRTNTSAWSSTQAMARNSQRAYSITQTIVVSINTLNGTMYCLGYLRSHV